MPMENNKKNKTETEITFGVFGGSGFYDFLSDAKELDIKTPYGAPSEKITVGNQKVKKLPLCLDTEKSINILHTKFLIWPIFGRLNR